MEREIDIATGRRSLDGHVRVSVFAAGLLALRIEGTGERVPTLLLTVEQAERLQQALEELVPLARSGDEGGPEASSASPWDGNERRASGSQ